MQAHNLGLTKVCPDWGKGGWLHEHRVSPSAPGPRAGLPSSWAEVTVLQEQTVAWLSQHSAVGKRWHSVRSSCGDPHFA